MRISDWSSDVCSSDLRKGKPACRGARSRFGRSPRRARHCANPGWPVPEGGEALRNRDAAQSEPVRVLFLLRPRMHVRGQRGKGRPTVRSEEHTSELQSLMRISYAVFCLKKKTDKIHT